MEELAEAVEAKFAAKDAARENTRNVGVGGSGYWRCQRSQQSKDRR